MSEHQVTSNGLRFCPLCNKPVNTESAYTRHVAYCRRTRDKPRKRKRSCRACHVAKARCSFDPECSRCRARGLQCIYEKPPLPGPAVGEAAEIAAAPGIAERSTAHDGRPGSESNAAENAVAAADSRSRGWDVLASNFGTSATLHLDIWAPRRVADVYADPVAQHSATFLLEAMRGVPRMMTRPEAPPWFIHGYCRGGAGPGSRPPDPLASCLAIAQLYLDREPCRRKASLWPVVDDENRRFMRDMDRSSRAELLLGKQAQIIYMIACMLDNLSPLGIPEVRLQMLMTYELYCKRFVHLDNNSMFLVDGIDDPCEIWGDWVYAESHRRTAFTWFLLSRVADLKFGVLCPVVRGYRTMPLPAPAALWNARTRAEWASVRDTYRERRGTGLSQCRSLRTFGDLIEARREPRDSPLGRQLGEWYANCDQLGLLLSLATTMV